MKRATGLLAIIAACAVSALAFAQSQETPPEEATAAAEHPAEQDAPPAADYVDLRPARPITGHADAGQHTAELRSPRHGPHGIPIAPSFPNIARPRADFLYSQLEDYKHNPDSPLSTLV